MARYNDNNRPPFTASDSSIEVFWNLFDETTQNNVENLSNIEFRIIFCKINGSSNECYTDTVKKMTYYKITSNYLTPGSLYKIKLQLIETLLRNNKATQESNTFIYTNPRELKLSFSNASSNSVYLTWDVSKEMQDHMLRYYLM